MSDTLRGLKRFLHFISHKLLKNIMKTLETLISSQN